ncbi:MAG: hypothetical protein KDN05_02905 [Verrucomicrobiae bacterium]|nr:hypothetical protein [Verrucomicrobiae bacterium]
MILRRLGTPPSKRDNHCVGCNQCPDVFELEDGDFAVIGKNETDRIREALPADAGCGDDERIVRIPRDVLLTAVRDLSREQTR